MPKALAAALGQEAVTLSLKRGDTFIKAGMPFSQVGFLQFGALRTFSSDEYGRELTYCLQVKPGSIIAPTPELDVSSPATIVALTESNLFVVNTATIQEMVTSNRAAEKYYNDAVCTAWKYMLEVQYVLKNKTANERYRWLTATFPELLGSIPDCYIASFLGMNPVTFSRIQTAEHKNSLI